MRCGAAAGEIAVIGGADIYRQTLPLADRIVFTRVHLRPAGDATFPAIDPQIWTETGREDFAAGPHDDASFTVLVFDRVGANSCARNELSGFQGHAPRRRTPARRVVTG